MSVEINCPRCNPDGAPRIRKLNREAICLICFNDGWTRFDKVCKCGEVSGVWTTCDKCLSSPAGLVEMVTLVVSRSCELPTFEGGPILSGARTASSAETLDAWLRDRAEQIAKEYLKKHG